MDRPFTQFINWSMGNGNKYYIGILKDISSVTDWVLRSRLCCEVNGKTPANRKTLQAPSRRFYQVVHRRIDGTDVEKQQATFSMSSTNSTLNKPTHVLISCTCLQVRLQVRRSLCQEGLIHINLKNDEGLLDIGGKD